MAENTPTQTSIACERFAVLVDVGCDWPEVVFVGDWSEAAEIAWAIPDEVGISLQAVVTLDEALIQLHQQ